MRLCPSPKSSFTNFQSLRELFSVSFYSQIIAMKGINSMGNKFVAKKLLESLPPPLPANKEESPRGPLNVVIAAGPFSTSDNLTFEPLADLIKVIKVKPTDNCACRFFPCFRSREIWPTVWWKDGWVDLCWELCSRIYNHFSAQRETPDVCILLGPILDIKNPEVENGKLEETYEEMFQRTVDQICNLTSKWVMGNQNVGGGGQFCCDSSTTEWIEQNNWQRMLLSMILAYHQMSCVSLKEFFFSPVER